MQKRVLDVGQCAPDHASLCRLVEALGATMVACKTTEEAMARLQAEHFDLVLVNRKLDSDYSDGTNLIAAMKKHPVTKEIPVMLVSNYHEAQKQAVGLGAVPGFGKAELKSAHVRARLLQVLQHEKDLAV